MRITIDGEEPVRAVRNWSAKQQAIFAAVSTGEENIIIEACAGGAKTSTIVEALYHLPPGRTAIFVAFNKAIADELDRRCPTNVDVATLHGVANQAVRSLGWSKVNARKVDNILKYEMVDEKCQDMVQWYWDNHKEICSFISTLKGFIQEFTAEQVLQMAQDAGIEMCYYTRSMLPALYSRSLEFTAGGKGQCVIDFDDMLRLPVVRNLPLPKYDYVFVDEVQDLNSIQREIVCRLRSARGRVVAVGDRHQAIYAFRGADSDSMELIAKRFNCIAYPLDVSYRCSQAVVAEARKIYPCIHATDYAAIGGVGRIKADSLALRVQAGDMVLCRTNAPMIASALALVKQGISVNISGGFDSVIMNYARKVAGRSGILTGEAITRFFESKILDASDKRGEYLTDIHDTLFKFLEQDKVSLVQVKEKVAKLFPEILGLSVRFSSIHRAKGLEANSVYLLRPDLIPHPKADLLEQEWNLMYVAITRAKDKFYYVD